MENFDRYGSVTLLDNKIVEFNEKKFTSTGYISVGCYVLDKKVLNDFNRNEKFSIEYDFFSKHVKEMPFNPYFYNNVFVDIGIPKDYETIKSILKNK